MTTEGAVRVRRPWHRTGKGSWSLSLTLGEFTVRVTQRMPDAVFERIIVLGGAQDWRSLETTDRELAELRARAFLLALVTEQEPEVVPEVEAEPAPTLVPDATSDRAPGRAPLTLGQLWDLYEESAAYQKLDTHTQANYSSSARKLLASLGADTDVTRLDQEALTAHANRRYAGGITYTRPKRNRLGQVMIDPYTNEPLTQTEVLGPVRRRSVGHDFQVLRLVLNWAERTRGPDGEYLLDSFPIRGGITVPREQNPVRPFADYERYCLLLQAIQRVAELAEAEADDTQARRCRLLELALVLVEATGRRIGSVRQLRRSDLELDERQGFRGARIHWRPEADKKKKGAWVPAPRELAALLYKLLTRLGVVGDALLFAQVNDPNQAVSTRELSEWAVKLEQAADLPHLKGGLWHPYRRKWAKERKDTLAIRDVMEAGGWSDIKTFIDSYNEPDFETMLEVMEAPARARESQAGAEKATDEVRRRSHLRLV
jgi:integrase